MLKTHSFAGLSLRDLEYVQAVAEQGSFGQAAVICGISQPAISQQIRKFETRLGFPIFERSRRQFFVTEEGLVVLAGIERILDEAASLLDISASLGSPLEGELRLGVIPTLGPYLMPLILRDIRRKFPNLKLSLVEEPTVKLEHMLQSREVDLVLLATAPETANLEEYLWFEEPYVYACPEGLGLKNQQPIQWADINQQTLLFPSIEHCMRDQTMAFCDLRSNPDRRVGTSLEMLRQMVASGEGATFLPFLSILENGRMGGLITLHPIADKTMHRTVRLCWRSSDRKKDAFKEFGAFLRQLNIPCS